MRFVVPEVKRLHLKNGVDWIDVKKELSVGEERKYRTRGMKSMVGVIGDGDPAVDIDWQLMSLSRVEAYVVDWSDKQKVSRESIEALASEDFDEIDELVKQHIAEMEALKKPQATPNPTNTTLQ